jgi:hypothetical protein
MLLHYLSGSLGLRCALAVPYGHLCHTDQICDNLGSAVDQRTNRPMVLLPPDHSGTSHTPLKTSMHLVSRTCLCGDAAYSLKLLRPANCPRSCRGRSPASQMTYNVPLNRCVILSCVRERAFLGWELCLPVAFPAPTSDDSGCVRDANPSCVSLPTHIRRPAYVMWDV